jgi:hypothetical protein
MKRHEWQQHTINVNWKGAKGSLLAGRSRNVLKYSKKKESIMKDNWDGRHEGTNSFNSELQRALNEKLETLISKPPSILLSNGHQGLFPCY